MRDKNEILYLAPADGVTKDRMIYSWDQSQNFDNGQSTCQTLSNLYLACLEILQMYQPVAANIDIGWCQYQNFPNFSVWRS